VQILGGRQVRVYPVSKGFGSKVVAKKILPSALPFWECAFVCVKSKRVREEGK